MAPTAEDFQRLVERVEALEAKIAINDLITTYGPAVDSGCAEAVASLWTEDGVYDVDTGVMNGSKAIEAMVRSKAHQSWIGGGCGHLSEPLHVVVDGDTAVATGHTQLVIHNGDGTFRVHRVTANRWELVRQDGAWKVAKRTGRVLDGRPEARDLLAAGVQ
ncbi:nuclear transport factor 2 family protein [Rhodococcus sp. D2-41]|uniref:Nuclear transport factor 2 family protein n=1 Tax=Speluncibacter jeojiensis TaxID=2710754 RepID=A0A9X4RDV5_9ACTN|nr:nuclear transport factor 2 family protein [Rhodococcus sp. D2-41]MDG3011667.1 nuclear transport factor 2 family protein [Rhodococcus sp. D2-41]MDG3014978.1 nuclear transport factor 2 family protein [Corynebacteriales bacterium D3-21]